MTDSLWQTALLNRSDLRAKVAANIEAAKVAPPLPVGATIQAITAPPPVPINVFSASCVDKMRGKGVAATSYVAKKCQTPGPSSLSRCR